MSLRFQPDPAIRAELRRRCVNPRTGESYADVQWDAPHRCLAILELCSDGRTWKRSRRLFDQMKRPRQVRLDDIAEIEARRIGSRPRVLERVLEHPSELDEKDAKGRQYVEDFTKDWYKNWHRWASKSEGKDLMRTEICEHGTHKRICPHECWKRKRTSVMLGRGRA